MGKRGHSEEKVLRIWRQSGDTVVEICRMHGISQQRVDTEAHPVIRTHEVEASIGGDSSEDVRMD